MTDTDGKVSIRQSAQWQSVHSDVRCFLGTCPLIIYESNSYWCMLGTLQSPICNRLLVRQIQGILHDWKSWFRFMFLYFVLNFWCIHLWREMVDILLSTFLELSWAALKSWPCCLKFPTIGWMVDMWRFQIQDFSRILFLWNCLILHISNWIVHFFIYVLQTLKVVYNIISKLKSKGGYMFCYFFIRNSQIFHFWHLPLTLKSPPSNTDHPHFLLIFPMFFANFLPKMLFFPYLEI